MPETADVVDADEVLVEDDAARIPPLVVGENLNEGILPQKGVHHGHLGPVPWNGHERQGASKGRD